MRWVNQCSDWIMGNCLPLIHHNQQEGGEDEYVISGNDQQPLAARRRSSGSSNGSSSRVSSHSNPSHVQSPAHSQQMAPAAVQSGSRGSSQSNASMQQREHEQIMQARRLTLIHQLPTDVYVEGGKGDPECIICMIDLVDGDRVRFLPCLHSYHVECIDDWLTRKFTCPSCMEPVETGLLSSYTAAELSLDQILSSSANSGSNNLNNLNTQSASSSGLGPRDIGEKKLQ